jgi:hypothetical protein
MTIYNAYEVWALYEKNSEQAKNNIKDIEVFCGKEPHFAGLNGWVFEQTIRYCITREHEALGVNLKIDEQVSLGGRAKADLQIGNILIELKTSGLFGLGDVEKYQRYKKLAYDKQYSRYLYLTWNETHIPYKHGLDDALGKENIFYLEEDGEWERFITVTCSTP